MSRRLLGAACVVAGAAGVIACLLAASAGMRDVMRTDGGFCASGGPYVIANQCSSSDIRLLLVGILGGLAATAIVAAGGAVFGRVGSASLLAWAALFGLLGWNFISQAMHPVTGQGTTGWLISGVVFWALAVGGLVPLASGLVGDARTAGRPDPVLPNTAPLVRAQFIPSGWGDEYGGSAAAGSAPAGPGSASMPIQVGGISQTVAPMRNPSAAWLGLWVVLIAVGGVIGAVASHALISALR